MKTNDNLRELHQILQIAAKGFYEAVMLIIELPPELYDQGLSSCERWLTILARDLEEFKEEVIGVNENAQK